MTELKRLRLAAGMTQTRVARKARVDRAFLSLAETNQRRLAPDQEERVRAVLLRAIRERAEEIRERAEEILGRNSSGSADGKPTAVSCGPRES